MVPHDLMDGYAVGQRLYGRVEFRAEGFGVFVEVARGHGWSVDAVIRFGPASDPGPAARLRVGDFVEVIVTGVRHQQHKLDAVLVTPEHAEPDAAPAPARDVGSGTS
jgi:hypothetical protein